MSERQLHLVRHGEVHNPDGVLYGRLPGFQLSELGERMAQAAATELRESGRSVGTLIASPLVRAQQSAAPIGQAFGLPIATDERIIEPTNVFEGSVSKRAFKNPRNWRHYLNPLRPSWGEPYRDIADRVLAAMDAAWETGLELSCASDAASDAAASDDASDAAGHASDDGAGHARGNAPGADIVMVSHQAVIWAAHRRIAGEPLAHNPATRRCELSSITTFAKRDGKWIELDYRTPAHGLLDGSIDVGAV